MPAPQRIAIDTEAQTVTIAWTADDPAVLSLDALRRACPCAACQQRRERGTMEAAAPRTWTDVQAEPVGSYGLRFHWDDGHNDGIYTWRRLRALSKEGA